MYAVTLALLLMSAIPTALQADQPAPQERNKAAKAAPAVAEPVDTWIVALKNANCREIRDIVHGLPQHPDAWADERTNSLICSVAASKRAAVQQVIDQLDQPATERSRSQLVMLPVSGRSADDIARSISEMVDRRGENSGVRIAADTQRAMVLVSGPPTFLEQARAIVKQLDRPSPSARLEFSWLHANAPSAEPPQPGRSLAASATDVPADLAAAAKEVERFGKIRLLGRLTSVAVEGQKFEISGTIADRLDAEVQGRLINLTADGHMRIELTAMLLQRASAPATQPGRTGSQRLFSLRTCLTLDRGQTLVLGTAPTGAVPGESAILVVQVSQ